MSWFLAVLGFVVLIILHEFGHFAAAKAVGMRVERFSLFFPPLLVRKKIGETEYAIGAIPAGGYVKISGMSPAENLPDEVRTRAYYSQPVWKRIVVIAAGPFVNLVLGLLLLIVFVWQIGLPAGNVVATVQKDFPATGRIHPGDALVAVNGMHGTVTQLSDAIAADRCAKQPPTKGCKAAHPLNITLRRDGRLVTLRMTPVYDPATKRMRLGFSYDPNRGVRQTYSFGHSLRASGTAFVNISKTEVTLPARILNPKERKQIHGIVGSYETTRQTILHDPADVVQILAIISIALAVVNLFPFLPLDGGHIFWALVELVRRRPVPFSTMERSGVIGFALVIMLFVIGLTNDISTLQNGGFKVR